MPFIPVDTLYDKAVELWINWDLTIKTSVRVNIEIAQLCRLY